MSGTPHKNYQNLKSTINNGATFIILPLHPLSLVRGLAQKLPKLIF